MGKALENQKNYSEAVIYYNKALELDPNDKIAKKNLKRCQKNFLVMRDHD